MGSKSRTIYNRADVRLALDTDNWNYIPGDEQQGESQSMVAQRMIKWSTYHSRSAINSNIAVFTHGLSIKFLLAEIQNLDRLTAYEMPIDNASVTI